MPGTVIPEPKGVLIVIVSATALPAASVADRCVVPESFCGRPGRSTSMARSSSSQCCGAFFQKGGSMRPRSFFAYAFDVSLASGTSTKSGSPNQTARSAKASFIASTTRCAAAGSSGPRSARSKPSRMFRISTRTAPPEEGGGNEITSSPR